MIVLYQVQTQINFWYTLNLNPKSPFGYRLFFWKMKTKNNK